MGKAPGRRPAVMLFVLALAALLPAAMASACTGGAFLLLDPPGLRPGQTVTVSGKGGFDPSPAASPVEVRVGSSPTPVWTGRPDGQGSFSFALTVPDVPPGYYLVVATQLDETGHRVRWCPCRAQLEVLGASGQRVAAATPGTPAHEPIDRLATKTSEDWVAVALLLASLVLFGAAAGTVVVSSRPKRETARVPLRG